MTSIAILGEYQPTSKTHLATEQAIAHSNLQLKTKVEGIWVASERYKYFLVQALLWNLGSTR